MINQLPRVAALQHESYASAIDDNLKRMGAVLQAAADHGAGLAVLPEAGLQGYGYDNPEGVRRDAVTISDASFRRVRDMVVSAGINAVIGFIERDGEHVFNSTALIDPWGQGSCAASQDPPPLSGHRSLRGAWFSGTPRRAYIRRTSRTADLRGHDLSGSRTCGCPSRS